MKVYRCPPEIANLFATEHLAATEGRAKALKWLKGLQMQIGDKVLVPDVGPVFRECEKKEHGLQ